MMRARILVLPFLALAAAGWLGGVVEVANYLISVFTVALLLVDGGIGSDAATVRAPPRPDARRGFACGSAFLAGSALMPGLRGHLDCHRQRPGIDPATRVQHGLLRNLFGWFGDTLAPDVAGSFLGLDQQPGQRFVGRHGAGPVEPRIGLVARVEGPGEPLLPVVVGLVERAAETFEAEASEKMAARLAKGQFDMNDLRSQLSQMQKMGGLGALAGMIPGMAKAKAAMANGGPDDKTLGRMEAVICSMTPKERAKPDLINAKRKIRIAKGAGTTVQEVNKLMKMHQEMETAMKRLRKMGGMKGMMAMLGKMGGGAGGPGGGLGGLLGGGGGLPPGFDKLMKR